MCTPDVDEMFVALPSYASTDSSLSVQLSHLALERHVAMYCDTPLLPQAILIEGETREVSRADQAREKQHHPPECQSCSSLAGGELTLASS